jgi:hypothetical protein
MHCSSFVAFGGKKTYHHIMRGNRNDTAIHTASALGRPAG